MVDVRQVELDARALEVSWQAAEKKGTGVFLLEDVEQGLHFVLRQESALKHGRDLVGFGCFRRYFFCFRDKHVLFYFEVFSSQGTMRFEKR